MAERKVKRQKGVRKVSVLTKLMLFINLIFAIILLLSQLSTLISPGDIWFLPFLGLVYPFLLLVNLFFVLFWLVFLKRYFIISLVIILAGYNQFSSLIQFGNKSEHIPSGAFKVMTYNVRLFDLYNWNREKEVSQARKEIFKMIQDEEVDVMCLQEYYSGRRSKVNYSETILGFGNYRYFFDGYINNGKVELPFGLITFSKYPIVAARKVGFSNSYDNFCLLTDIAFPHDTLRVINTHLESFRFGREDYLFMNELANNTGTNNDITQGSKAILKKMKAAYQKRASQVNELAGIIEASPYKVVVCADFNDTPVSYSYRRIAKNHYDAFRESGKGFGQSYTQFLPFLRIDYIFTDRSLRILDYRTIHNDFSDHYPIIATLDPASNSQN